MLSVVAVLYEKNKYNEIYLKKYIYNIILLDKLWNIFHNKCILRYILILFSINLVELNFLFGFNLELLFSMEGVKR